MKYLLRLLLLPLAVCILTKGFGQITYDVTLPKQYDSVYSKLQPEFKKAAEMIEKDKGNLAGIAVSTIFNDDTLNGEDLIALDDITILDIDGNKMSADTEKMPGKLIMLLISSKKGDTLNIEVIPWYMSNQIIRHIIIGDQVQTTYNEFYKKDSILKADNTAPKTNDLTIPATSLKFILSDKLFSKGKTIYGMAEIITADFQYLNATDFKDELLKHRYHFKYYFKFKIGKKSP